MRWLGGCWGGVGLERGVDIEVLLRKRGGEIGSRSRFEGETLRRGFEISAVKCGGGDKRESSR